MIFVFYSNDPLGSDQGGGAEHFRGLYRALCRSGEAFAMIAAKLQDERIDPRVTYVSKGSHFLRWWLALWLWTWRHRDVFQQGDICHFHRNYAAWPCLLLARRRVRIVVTYHNVTGAVIKGMVGRWAVPLRAAMRLAERRVAARADAIICVSARDREALASEIEAAPFRRARVIPAAFDAAGFGHPVNPPTPAMAREVLFLGRLSHQKNLPLLIETFEMVASRDARWRLTIAGDGEDRPWLVRRVRASPFAERVAMLGLVAHEQVPAVLERHGLVIVTSRYEASPTVVKEARAAGRYCVTTDVGDVAAWLEDGVTGKICGFDPNVLAAALEEAAARIDAGRGALPPPPAALDERAIMARVIQLYNDLKAA